MCKEKKYNKNHVIKMFTKQYDKYSNDYVKPS